MVSTQVPVQAKLIITRLLTQSSAQSRPVVEDIELFRHALEPHNILFGTAKVDGQLTALPETILVALRAQLVGTEAAPPARRRATAAHAPRLLASRLRRV